MPQAPCEPMPQPGHRDGHWPAMPSSLRDRLRFRERLRFRRLLRDLPLFLRRSRRRFRPLLEPLLLLRFLRLFLRLFLPELLELLSELLLLFRLWLLPLLLLLPLLAAPFFGKLVVGLEASCAGTAEAGDGRLLAAHFALHFGLVFATWTSGAGMLNEPSPGARMS